MIKKNSKNEFYWKINDGKKYNVLELNKEKMQRYLKQKIMKEIFLKRAYKFNKLKGKKIE